MPDRKHGLLLVTLFLGVLMAALDIAVLGPAIPAIRAHYGVDDRIVSWAFSTFVFFNLVGVPVMSKLADVFGRRRVYLVDVALFALGAVVVATAPSFSILLVGRALQGLAASGIFPVAAAVIGDVFPTERRGRALGVLGAVFGVAFMVGPVLAGILLLTDWRLIYFSYLPLAAVVLVLAARQLPHNPRATSSPFDWRGVILLAAALVSLAYGLNRIDTTHWLASLQSPRVYLPLLLVAAAVPLFVWAERTASDPLVRPGLFRSRQVVLAGFLAACAGLTESAFIFLPALAVSAFGVSTSTASFMLLPLVTAVAVTAPLAGRILDRVGSKRVVLVCQAFLTLGMAMIAIAGRTHWGFYGGSVLIGAGLAGILGPALSYILLSEARVQERTVSQGLITLFISVGQLVGGAVIGAVSASVGAGAAGYSLAFTAIAVVSLAGLVSGFALQNRSEERRRSGQSSE